MRNVLAVVLLSVLAWAQAPEPKKEGPPPVVRKVIDVKYLSGERAERAVKLVSQFMHPSQVNFDPVLRTVVMIGQPDVVTAGEALLRKFDVPGGVRAESQVQFRFYLVEASPDPARSGPVPAEIASAVEQMKKSFAYKGYRLLDTLLLHARGSGEARIDGTLSSENESQRPVYSVSYKQADVLEDGKAVVVRGFMLHLRLPVPAGMGQYSFTEATIRTDMTVQAGQKLVVGKMSSTAATSAIFVIVTADVQ